MRGETVSLSRSFPQAHPQTHVLHILRRPKAETFWKPVGVARRIVHSIPSAGPRRQSLGFQRVLADGVGFEPTRRLRACRFSRPVPSTTRPPILATDQ